MISILQSSGVTHPGDGGKVLDVLHAHVQLTHELGAPELPHVQFVDVCDVGDAPQTPLQNGHVHIPGNTLGTQHAKSYMAGKTQQRTLETLELLIIGNVLQLTVDCVANVAQPQFLFSWRRS